MKDLIKVANELQKVMDFEEGGPPVDGTEKELTKWVEEAVDEIDYVTDKFSDFAVAYLIDQDLWKGPLLEEEEPEVEEAEVVEEVSDNLVDQVKAAGTMRDLKIICKDLDEFKSIRGQVTKYKTMKELREVMLGMLEGEKKPEVAKKATTKSAPEKKPVEKKEEKTPVVKKETKQKGLTDHSKSNKAIVYLAWKDGEKDLEKLHKKVNENVKLTTIKGWTRMWGNKKGLPAIAKEVENAS